MITNHNNPSQRKTVESTEAKRKTKETRREEATSFFAQADSEGGTISSANPADASLFAIGLSIRETVPRQTFTPSAPACIEISNQMYTELVTDDTALAKQMLPEYVSYYSTTMLWLRILSLKMKNSQPLTQAEQDLQIMTQATAFAIPEPPLLQLGQ